jgi:hypothetical protein
MAPIHGPKILKLLTVETVSKLEVLKQPQWGIAGFGAKKNRCRKEEWNGNGV